MEAAKAAGVEGALAAQVWGSEFQRCTTFYPSYEAEVLHLESSLRAILFDLNFFSSFTPHPGKKTRYMVLQTSTRVPFLLVPKWAALVDGIPFSDAALCADLISPSE